MDRWKPIETAPTDGREILLFLDNPPGFYRPPEMRMAVGFAYKSPIDGSTNWAIHKYETPEGRAKVLTIEDPVTHWRNLPPPPEGAR